MKGFWQRLFDFSFREFITPSIVKIIFWIAIILTGLGVLANIITSFIQGPAEGVLSLILAPIVGILAVIMTRVYLEVVMVFFRILGLMEGIAKDKGVSDTSSVISTPPPPPGE